MIHAVPKWTHCVGKSRRQSRADSQLRESHLATTRRLAHRISRYRMPAAPSVAILGILSQDLGIF